MKKELFVVTSYHHILTAIAKKYIDFCEMDIFISNFSSGDEYWNEYIDYLRSAGWFKNVFYFDERKIHPPSPIHPIATYKYEILEEKQIISTIEGFRLESYDLVYLIDDKMFLGSTIVRENIPYHLCEDTVLTYQLMNKTKSSKVMCLPYNIIYKILKICNYWHPVFGYADNCEMIETSSVDDLPNRLPFKKVELVDRMNQINSIPETDKKIICELFLDKKNIDYMKRNKDVVMILTCPLKKGDLDHDAQISVLKRVMFLYPKSTKFVIKPHPRDDTDYKIVFPEIVVLKRSFPSEILGFIEDFEIDEIISVGSTSVNSCNFAKKKSLILLSELNKLSNDKLETSALR